MVMLSADATDVTHRCGNCGAESSTPLIALEAGSSVVRKNVTIVADENIIRLPPCGGCGAVKTVSRRFEDQSDYPDYPLSLKISARWQLINAVHKKLVDANQVNAQCAAVIAAEIAIPKLVATLPFTANEG